MLLLFVIDLFYIMLIWPDWDDFKQGAIPKSRFIHDYEAQMKTQPYHAGLNWQPIPLKYMPRHLQLQ